MQVFVAFLVSCLLLAATSCVVALDPNLSAKLYFSRGEYTRVSGIFVKNYIDQGQEFSLCAVALAYPVVTSLRDGRLGRALLLAAVALALVANMMFVVISRKHLLLFRGEGLVNWIGLLVVIQNMLTSTLNSHLFDFTEGWIYVLGVGVAAGQTLASRVSLQSSAPEGSASTSILRP